MIVVSARVGLPKEHPFAVPVGEFLVELANAGRSPARGTRLPE
jgi:hypothetical protein